VRQVEQGGEEGQTRRPNRDIAVISVSDRARVHDQVSATYLADRLHILHSPHACGIAVPGQICHFELCCRKEQREQCLETRGPSAAWIRVDHVLGLALLAQRHTATEGNYVHVSVRLTEPEQERLKS